MWDVIDSQKTPDSTIQYTKFFLQKIISRSAGKSVPLLYPEAMLFSGIFYKDASEDCAVLGAIPAPLLNASIEKLGFASIPKQVRTRLTCASCKLFIIIFFI